MRTIKWTREKIIRDILDREAAGRSLNIATAGGSDDSALYQAGRRVFGSWTNAVMAAGISPGRVLPAEKWTPARVITVIRNLSRRKSPLTSAQLERRYGQMAAAARRYFGSWPKAVLAAGVDPAKLRRSVPWTRDTVIEAILVRALRGEPMNARAIQPRSLVHGAQKIFGTWHAAKDAAGLDSGLQVRPEAVMLDGVSQRVRFAAPITVTCAVSEADYLHVSGQPWTEAQVVACIHIRLSQNKRMNATAVSEDYDKLYRAGRRFFGSWNNSLIAAGLNPFELPGFRRIGPPPTHGTDESKSHANGAVRQEHWCESP